MYMEVEGPTQKVHHDRNQQEAAQNLPLIQMHYRDYQLSFPAGSILPQCLFYNEIDNIRHVLIICGKFNEF